MYRVTPGGMYASVAKDLGVNHDGDCVHLCFTRRWCQASRVRGETIRRSRRAWGISRVRTASSARSGQSGLGAVTCRRRISIYAFLAAEDRDIRNSHAKIRVAMR
ncbi:hypothetical protein ACWDSL_52580 [Streptomyces sp. NPDC000941]